MFRLERLRLHDGEPLIYSVDVLPAEHARDPEDTDWRGSLFTAPASGLQPVTAVATICAAHLPPTAATMCGTDLALPWLLMVQVNLLADELIDHLLPRLPPGRPLFLRSLAPR